MRKDGATAAKALEGICGELFPQTLVASAASPDWRMLHALWMGKDAAAVAELLVAFMGAAKNIKPAVSKAAVAALAQAAKARMAEAVKTAEAAQKVLEDEDLAQVLIDAVLSEDGVGSVLRKDAVFGGVERVADSIRRTREGVVRCFESV